MTTITKIKQAVLSDISRDKINNDLYLKVYAALEKFDGDKITKRFATSVQKDLGPEYSVYYSDSYGMYHLRIKKANESTQNWKDFLLGHQSSPYRPFKIKSGDTKATVDSIYSERGFDYHNAWAGSAAVERIAKNEKVLKSGKLEKLAELHDQKMEIERKIDKLNLESYDFPAMFAVERELSNET